MTTIALRSAAAFLGSPRAANNNARLYRACGGLVPLLRRVARPTGFFYARFSAAQGVQNGHRPNGPGIERSPPIATEVVAAVLTTHTRAEQRGLL